MSEFKEHLDGPRLAAWLEERFPELAGDANTPDSIRAILGADGAARLRRWRKGAVAHLDGADKICVALGLVIDQDLPDDLWVDPPHKKVRLTWEQRRALEMLDEGFYPTEVGRLLGVNAKTVRQWRWRMKERAAA